MHAHNLGKRKLKRRMASEVLRKVEGFDHRSLVIVVHNSYHCCTLPLPNSRLLAYHRYQYGE